MDYRYEVRELDLSLGVTRNQAHSNGFGGFLLMQVSFNGLPSILHLFGLNRFKAVLHYVMGNACSPLLCSSSVSKLDYLR